MSIVAQKRNSRRFKAPISGRGTKGFSLNGGMRNQGWVGQTNLGRSNVGTVFRGAFPMGNGGCCGTYVINTQNSGGPGVNDPNIIKRSTMNTKGLIEATVEHPTIVFNGKCTEDCGPDPSYDPVEGRVMERIVCKTRCKTKWAKNMSAFAFSSGEQIKWKKITAASKNIPWSVDKKSQGIKSCPTDCGAASFWIGGKHYIREPYAKDLNLFSVSPSMYQEAGLMRKNILPTPKCLTPFPFVLNHNSTCQVNFKTPTEAIEDGILPLDWMSCEQTPNCCKPCEDRGLQTFQLNMIANPFNIPVSEFRDLFYSTGVSYTESVGSNVGFTQTVPSLGSLPPGQSGLVVDCDQMHIIVIRGSNDGGGNLAAVSFTAALFEAVKPLPDELSITIKSTTIPNGSKNIPLGNGYRWPSPDYATVNGWPLDVPFEYKMANGKPALLYYWNTSGVDLGAGYPPPLHPSVQKDLNRLIQDDAVAGTTYRIELKVG